MEPIDRFNREEVKRALIVESLEMRGRGQFGMLNLFVGAAWTAPRALGNNRPSEVITRTGPATRLDSVACA